MGTRYLGKGVPGKKGVQERRRKGFLGGSWGGGGSCNKVDSLCNPTSHSGDTFYPLPLKP